MDYVPVMDKEVLHQYPKTGIGINSDFGTSMVSPTTETSIWGRVGVL